MKLINKELVILVSVVICILSITWLSACKNRSVKFDPSNEEHVVEIYARTSFGGEEAIKVIDKYGLKDPEVMEQYSMALAERALTPEIWQEFIAKVEAKKAELEK